jgi:hypothetical protein
MSTGEGGDLLAELVEVDLALGFADQLRHVVHGLSVADVLA